MIKLGIQIVLDHFCFLAMVFMRDDEYANVRVGCIVVLIAYDEVPIRTKPFKGSQNETTRHDLLGAHNVDDQCAFPIANGEVDSTKTAASILPAFVVLRSTRT